MAVNAEVQIMNSALIKLGAEVILSPDDDSTRARLCKTQYPITRDALLRAHPWRFATGYYSLAAISPKPPEIYDYDFVFQLPDDVLRVIGTSLNHTEEWAEIEGNRIACNTSEITVKCIKKVTDVSKYDDNFIKVLVLGLAVDIGPSVTKTAALLETIRDEYTKELRPTRSFNAQVGSVQRVISDDWLNSRRY